MIAWARRLTDEHGIDSNTIFLSRKLGRRSSRGHGRPHRQRSDLSTGLRRRRHLDHRRLSASTATTAGSAATGNVYPTTPLAHTGSHAPPIFVINHGDQDTYTPAEAAHALVDRLCDRHSTRPVVYAELPGARRSFDLFHSIRFETVVDAIEAFAVHASELAYEENAAAGTVVGATPRRSGV